MNSTWIQFALVWYGYFVCLLVFFFCSLICRFPVDRCNRNLTSSTTMGVVQWVRCYRMQFACFLRDSFCLIANHSISNGLQINLSRLIKLQTHVFIYRIVMAQSSWNCFFHFIVDTIVITTNARPSNQKNLHFFHFKFYLIFAITKYKNKQDSNAVILFATHVSIQLDKNVAICLCLECGRNDVDTKKRNYLTFMKISGA